MVLVDRVSRTNWQVNYSLPMHATKCSQQVSYRVEPRRKDLEEEAVYEFSNEEDAPMCIDVHPVVKHQRPKACSWGLNSIRVIIGRYDIGRCQCFRGKYQERRE